MCTRDPLNLLIFTEDSSEGNLLRTLLWEENQPLFLYQEFWLRAAFTVHIKRRSSARKRVEGGFGGWNEKVLTWHKEEGHAPS